MTGLPGMLPPPAVGRQSAHNPHATNANAAGRELTLLHEAGDLDHRTFVGFDLRHQLLRPVHPQMHAFGNVDAPG